MQEVKILISRPIKPAIKLLGLARLKNIKNKMVFSFTNKEKPLFNNQDLTDVAAEYI